MRAINGIPVISFEEFKSSYYKALKAMYEDDPEDFIREAQNGFFPPCKKFDQVGDVIEKACFMVDDWLDFFTTPIAVEFRQYIALCYQDDTFTILKKSIDIVETED